MFYFDWTYVVLVLPFAILAMWASFNVNSTFKKYAKQFSRRGISGADAAAQVLAANYVRGVRIERVSGNLTDHFDPKSNVIRLSESVYDSTSTAAIGVACHEAGHAVQYAQEYSPMKLRAAIIPITRIGSILAMPLILLGTILHVLENASFVFVYAGIACFGTSLLLQLITLPVEFNASARAMQAIRGSDMLDDMEAKGARKVLTAAALTYIAAAAVSLVQLLRLILLFGGRRRND